MTEPPESTPPTTRVSGPTGSTGAAGRSRVAALSPGARWLIGGAAVALAVAIIAGAVALLGARPLPEALAYVPRDSAVVAELRPDLPGDQMQRVGNVLAHFPGFKDQSTLAQKLDESLARITSAASNGQVDWASQVKPWLAGPLFTALEPAAATGGPPEYVVVFTTDGTVTCDPLVAGGQVVGTHQGLDVHMRAGAGPSDPACVIDGRHALFGSEAAVEAALDAHAADGGMDGDPTYRAARGRLGGDRLATVFVVPRALTGLGAGVPSRFMTPPIPSGTMAALPEWLMAGIRAEDNALVGDLVSAPFDATRPPPLGSLPPGASFAPGLPPHVSAIAPLLPADTAVLYEVHGTGIALQNLVTEVRSMPDTASQLDQLDSVLGLLGLGGTTSALGWVGDAGLVVLPDGTSATGGLVALTPDAATATDRAAQLVGLLRLSKAFGGPSVTLTETTIDGTKVSLADLGDASSLLGALGNPGGLGSGGPSIPPGTRVVISIAAHGSAVLIGSSESFARRIIETSSGAALADQPAYRTAIGLADARNSSQLYVAAEPARKLLEPLLPADRRAYYESDIRPYLAPFDAVLETATMDATGLRARLVISVRQVQ